MESTNGLIASIENFNQWLQLGKEEKEGVEWRAAKELVGNSPPFVAVLLDGGNIRIL